MEERTHACVLASRRRLVAIALRFLVEAPVGFGCALLCVPWHGVCRLPRQDDMPRLWAIDLSFGYSNHACTYNLFKFVVSARLPSAPLALFRFPPWHLPLRPYPLGALPLPTLAHVLCVPPPQRAAGFATRRSLAGVGLSTSPAVQVGGGVDNETGEHSIKNHLGQTVALPAGEVSDLIAVEKERNRRYYVRAAPIPSAPITPALLGNKVGSAPAEQCL